MSNKFSKSALFVAAIAASSVAGVSQALAEPQAGTQVIQNMSRDALIANPSQLQNTTAQGVTSVSQFSDVQPTDWAFTALQSLVERYGCIAGYPDKTFRGQRATSRYEFAAGLNACLDKINELISSGLADKVGKEDLASLQKLQEEFSAELATIKGRLSATEAKVATLEAQQFSTTTKLTGSVIFAGAGSFGDNSTANGNRNITLASRVRLNFNTSFYGKDLLFIRLQAGSVQNNTGNQLTRLAFDEGNNAAIQNQSSFTLDRLYYRFPVTSQVTVTAGTTLLVEDVLDVSNPDLSASERGSVSRFVRRDPLVFRGQEGTGAGVSIKFNDQLGVNLAYLADSTTGNTVGGNTNGSIGSAALPSSGVFGSGYSASAQILFKPVKPLALSLVYQYGYDAAANGINLTNGTSNGGVGFVNDPFSTTTTTRTSTPTTINGVLTPTVITTTTTNSVATTSNRVGFQANFDLSNSLSFNGRITYANARSVATNASADILTWLVSASIKDLFAQGNQASIAFGQPPFVFGGDVASTSYNPYLIEALYRFQLNKNISITPALITVLNPGTGDNSPVFVGVLRTSFSF